MTWALLSIGTALKSKLSSVLPGGRRDSSEMALDSTSGALGDFEFGERREESYGRPALFVGPRGDVLPEAVDGGQPQLVQQ